MAHSIAAIAAALGARAEGDVAGALTAYAEGLEIARTLSARDPVNVQWTRDLSVWLDRVGDLRRVEGDMAGALAAYTEGLEIARPLSAHDPDNAAWARDLSVSLDRVGDVRKATGERARARDAYIEGLEIARGLSARDPGNTEWARDVWVSYSKLAQADPDHAAAHWDQVVTRMEAMQAAGTLLPGDLPFLDHARQARDAARAGP